jgi:hypothetical protein
VHECDAEWQRKSTTIATNSSCHANRCGVVRSDTSLAVDPTENDATPLGDDMVRLDVQSRLLPVLTSVVAEPTDALISGFNVHASKQSIVIPRYSELSVS